MDPGMVVISDTPSLGSSLAALFESAGLRVVRADGVVQALRLLQDVRTGPCPVVVAANTGYHCPSIQEWRAGRLGPRSLVVVGTRDSSLRSDGQLHVVRLPLDPDGLLCMLRGLLDAPAAT
jgi:hypothetical protein